MAWPPHRDLMLLTSWSNCGLHSVTAIGRVVSLQQFHSTTPRRVCQDPFLRGFEPYFFAHFLASAGLLANIHLRCFALLKGIFITPALQRTPTGAICQGFDLKTGTHASPSSWSSLSRLSQVSKAVPGPHLVPPQFLQIGRAHV